MIIKSIRFKASILYSSILCLILVGFSVYLFHSVRRILYQNTEDELILKADQIAGTINAYGEVTGGRMPAMSLMRRFLSDPDEGVEGREVLDKLWEKHRWILDAHNDYFILRDTNGQVVLGSENLPTGAERVFSQHFSVLTHAGNTSDLKISGAPYRGMRYPFTFAGRRTLILELVVPLAPVNRVLSGLLAVMIGGITFVLLMSFSVGSFLTRRILKPVSDVTQTANNISQKNLSVRIPTSSMDLEMQLLVDSFNQMIDRLEKSFAHINEFSSHVAHELKTPLTIIKGELELALSGETDEKEARRVMTVALQEVDRLIRISKDLLLLAKLEYSLNIFKMERMELGAFLKDIYQHSRILAAEKGIQIEFSVPDKELWIQGDMTHLRRLFFNLVHNAVKFTPSEGLIKVLAETSDGSVRVSISDTGEGISLADQAKVFDKFYTVRKAEHKDAPGTGLGLAMVRSIAKAHGGDVTVESELKKGSVFTVILPLL